MLGSIGFGLSQVIPIIVEGINRKNSHIIIEQPELHLHPKLQGDIADFFISSHKKCENRFIIETHSEHILLRLQRRIAEKIISKEDLSIYYFELTEEGTNISQIILNENGSLDKWPKGFFEEDVDESIEILNAISGEKKN